MGKVYDTFKACAKVFWGAILGVMIIAIAPYFLLFGIALIFFGAMFYPFVFLWKKYVEKFWYPKNIVFRKWKLMFTKKKQELIMSCEEKLNYSTNM